MKLYHINEEASNVTFSTPEELYKFLVEETEFSVHKRRLQTIDEIWKSRKLDCWEAVDFQDYYLKQMSVVKNVRRIYISYLMKDRYKYPENGEHDPVIIDNEKYYWVSDGSHSVSMFEYKNKVYYLEVANRMKQGLYEFNSWKEAITFLYKEFTSESRKDIHMIDKLVIFDYTNIDIPRRFTNSHFEANSQYINAVFKGKMLYEKDIQKKIKESVDNQHDFIRDVLFDRIKNIFKTKFGWNVDYMKFKYTDVPRYNNNKPNPNMFIDEFGGCHTKHPYNTIYLSTTLDRTIKYYKLNMTKVEFASIIIAHELAHEVHMYFLTTQQREEYYKRIPTEFWSVYLDRVKKDPPEKINEELFCEYIANLVSNYLKQNNMWKESMLKASTNILYHGSPVQNLKIIEPRILFTPDQKDIPRVFAADKKIVALMFLHKRGTPLGMGEVDGNWYIKEKEPNAFDGYKIKGSIYTIKNERFTKLDSGFDEYVSYEPVEVIKEEQYDNVWNVLLQLEKTKQLRLIRYNDTTYDEYETINSGIFYVDKSTIEEGNGTFAKKDIKKNTKIAVAFIKTNNTGDMNRDYKSTILGEYTKHSNTPNLNIRKNNEKIVFYSNRFIKKDEELTVNYKQFDWVWKKDFVETCIKRGDKTMRILKEFELNTQADPMTLDEVTRRLYTAFNKIKEIDDKEYILNLGIYGSTAKGTRTKKSPIDIYVFLNPNTIQKPIINDERIQNSLFGVPNEYWEPMRDILVDAFGINPFTKKPYVINVMSEYEVRNKKDNIYTDMLVLKGKRLVRYKVLYSETVKKNLKVPFLIETTVLNFPQVRQSTDYSCGASAVRAVLVYYGKDIREDQLIQTMHTSKENGTDPKNMMQYLRKQAFKVDFGTMTVQKLKEYIDKKIPVIVLIQAWADDEKEYKETLDNGHYAVVIGYTDTKFLFEDPSIYERGYLTFDEFEKRWKDISSEGKIYTKCGIAVYGAEPKYSEEEFIRIE